MSVEPFIGEINILPYNFTPEYYAACNGNLMLIGQYQVLYAVIGAKFGGDARSTFAVPDLAGRTPLHRDPSFPFAQPGGTASETLNQSQIPSHDHTWTVLLETGPNNTQNPDDTMGIAQKVDVSGGPGIWMYAGASAPLDQPFAASAVQASGAGKAHTNRQPYLALNFCMAFDGIFPSRN
jgi:microcystin-dependent protein